jgi:hypothetical protein
LLGLLFYTEEESSVDFQQTTRLYIPADSHCENLKSYKNSFVCHWRSWGNFRYLRR